MSERNTLKPFRVNKRLHKNDANSQVYSRAGTDENEYYTEYSDLKRTKKTALVPSSTFDISTRRSITNVVLFVTDFGGNENTQNSFMRQEKMGFLQILLPNRKVTKTELKLQKTVSEILRYSFEY